MKDPTIPPPDKRKKIMFYESEERQTELRIRCNFDGITQSQFFRMMLEGYVGEDELVLKYLENCKEKYQIQGQQKRNKIGSINKQKKQTEKKFALQNDEIEDIFDMIEMETDI